MTKEEFTALLKIYFRVRMLGSGLHICDFEYEKFMEERGEILEKLTTLIDNSGWDEEWKRDRFIEDWGVVDKSVGGVNDNCNT